MSKMMRNYLVGLSLAIIIYAVVVFWFIKRDILLPAELLDTIILFILASATIFYAMRTSDIAEATREQAKEMRERRLAAKPVLIPDIDFEKGSYDNVMKSIAQGDFPVAVTNVGTQAAIEIEVTMKGPDEKIGNSYKLPLLLPGATWKSIFVYVNEFDESGEPIFGLPPPEGLYELGVTFKPATSDNALFSEVSLPFELRWSRKPYYYNVMRSGLNIKLQE